MDTKELLKKVRRVEIKTRGLSKQIFSGEYHSAFKGKGMSFSEVREYQYGDDVRNIDWNVTARTGAPYVKIFEEERELTVMLLIDLSGSSFFGSQYAIKRDIILEISALLSFSAINNNDKVGAIIFTDRIEQFIPPKKGKQHILFIIRELLNAEPKGTGTNITQALQYFNNAIKKRSICFLLSDFQDDNYLQALRVAARKHDLVGIRIYDEMEMALPGLGVLPAIDLETGKEILIDTNTSSYKKQYAQVRLEELNYLEKSFRTTRADLVTIPTDGDYTKALINFFQKRST